jgi:hypothetical protein
VPGAPACEVANCRWSPFQLFIGARAPHACDAMIHVRTEVTIDAPLGRVWSTLADLRGWSRWNSIFVDGVGVARVGERFRFRVAVPGLPALPIVAKFTRAEPERALYWRGSLGPLVAGEHGFSLERDGERTRVIHEERFTGPLAEPLVGRIADRLERAYRTVNEDLRRRLEA